MLTTALLVAGLLAAQDTQPIAFVNVNVLPMDRERVLENYTVVVRRGRIESLGPAARTPVPGGALRIDGRGRYLMPGFAEMHGHLPNPDAPNSSFELAETVLLLYVASGVTAVRGMQGHPPALELRRRIARGELLGPRLWVAGPPLSGNSARTPEDGQRLVEEQKAAGYDLLKIQEGLEPQVYQAVVAAARRLGLPFGGHVPNAVGLREVLASGQISVDHLDNYVETLGGPDSADDRRIAELVAATRAAGAWIVPTLALWETFLTGDPDTLARRPELAYVPPQWRANWTQQLAGMRRNNPDVAAGARVAALRRRVLKALADGGARIVFGTDSPQLFSVPGFSIHHEIRAMREAGLTPFQILESGTRRVAEYFGATDDFGVVAPGMRADLVLLNGNPLEDLSRLQGPAGVMVAGRWLPDSEIRLRLERIAARFREP
ncbi:MAG TPA: amidohydrolase family protein [Gemmatimonadales bacterium]|nr:amidohydrolase family protein [Gemmatimonadales bacterium]